MLIARFKPKLFLKSICLKSCKINSFRKSDIQCYTIFEFLYIFVNINVVKVYSDTFFFIHYLVLEKYKKYSKKLFRRFWSKSYIPLHALYNSSLQAKGFFSVQLFPTMDSRLDRKPLAYEISYNICYVSKNVTGIARPKAWCTFCLPKLHSCAI